MTEFHGPRGGKPGLFNELRRLAAMAALALCVAAPAFMRDGGDARAQASAAPAVAGSDASPAVARARIDHAWRVRLAADPHARPTSEQVAAVR